MKYIKTHGSIYFLQLKKLVRHTIFALKGRTIKVNFMEMCPDGTHSLSVPYIPNLYTCSISCKTFSKYSIYISEHFYDSLHGNKRLWITEKLL